MKEWSLSFSGVYSGNGRQIRSIFRINFFLFKENKDGVPKGIRTPVTAVKGRCPRPLDDGDNFTLNLTTLYAFFFSGASRDRTGDLLHAMQALSQLSYSPSNLL